MELKDLKSGMAILTKNGVFHVIAEDGAQKIAVFYDKKEDKMDWRGLELFNFDRKDLPYRIEKVFESCCVDGWQLVWEEKPFTKADLKTGMRVITRSGKEEYVVMLNTPEDVLLCVDGGWDELDNYADDLLHKEFGNLDIIKIFEITRASKFLTPLSSIPRDSKTLLWERKE